MQCPSCKKSVAKKDAFCRHCGKAIPPEAKVSPPPEPWHPSHEHDEQDEGAVLAQAYRHMFGDKYMDMMAKLFGLNPDKAIAIMRGDVEVWFGSRPKKSAEELKGELDEFFNDPVTLQNMNKPPDAA